MNKSAVRFPSLSLCFVLACVVSLKPAQAKELTSPLDTSHPFPFAQSPSQITAASLANAPADLKEILGEIKASAKAGDREKLAAIFGNMQIPNAEAWFKRTFGPEESGKLTAAYEKERQSEDQFLVNALLQAAPKDGLLAPCLVPHVHVEGEPDVLVRLRTALKEPADFYGAGYFWKEDPNLRLSINFSFLTKIDGSYRRFPGDLVWLLQAPGAKPEAGISIDPQLLTFLKGVTSVPPPVTGGVIGGVIAGAGAGPPPGGFAERAAAAMKLGPAIDGQISCIKVDKATLKAEPILGCQAGRRVTLVQPVYPPLARQTRIQGTVILHALIDKDGTISALEVISGHPLLIQAAMDAVKQWRYEPTLLNGGPVSVDTTINVFFSLNP